MSAADLMAVLMLGHLHYDWHQPDLPANDQSGVRLIGIDRPGFGGSTHQAQRRYNDWRHLFCLSP